MCVYVCGVQSISHIHVHEHTCVHGVEVKGQLLDSLLPCGFLGWSSGHRAWWEVPGLWNHFTRPTELLKLCCFLFYYFMCLRGFPACMSVHYFCVPGTYICQKSELGTLELELDICEPPRACWESNQTF